MDNILEEASHLLQCKECPWYKSCVMPLHFPVKDFIKDNASSPARDNPEQASIYGLNQLFANMASAAENLIVEACPIFVKRLKASPKLAEQLKKMMQSWGEV